jgi:hypothetical protein
MDVAVSCKSRHRPTAKPSLLGTGLLERARSTSLALLGATAAVGLAIVALALNQDWPLISGSGIPSIPPRQQSVDRASVAAAGAAGTPTAGRVAGAPGKNGAGDEAGRVTGGSGPSSGTAPEGASELIVAPATPTSSGNGEREHGSAGKKSPAQSPSGSPQGAPTAALPTSTSQPSSSPGNTPATPAPPATVSSAPEEESNVPSWSHGNGHAYGRGEDWGGHDYSPEDDGDDWDDHGHDSGGHGHDWGGHD